MKNSYFAELLPELATRASRATLGRLGFSNPALRRFLSEAFSREIGAPGSYIGEPVFEATFGWEQADKTLAQLSADLLTPKTVAALDQPPKDKDGRDSSYRFPRDAFPYKHQLEAWGHLSRDEPRSVVVTSGTGSGKTECFMVPILDSLARQVSQSGQKLVGVQALFLYPLNALIESQKERLHAWTASFDGSIRFCLYNGNTPDREPQHRRDAAPNQVIDREVLRAAPPPILVTNATMLEYMLVRAQDANMLKASRGQLKWIVLDEAHTYIGSQAAELALLLRRVLHAFDVEACNVRFVATSATIGGGEAAEQLKHFLADLAGLPADRVHVVSGRRKIPELIAGTTDYRQATLEQLEALPMAEPEVRYAAFCANQTARRIRQLFVPEDGRARQLRRVIAELFGAEAAVDHASQITALRWLDLLTSARFSSGREAVPFLPLRMHIFHNVLAGLWACVDQSCTCKDGTALDAPEWAFGMLYQEERRHCDCGAPVFELRSCSDCNTTYLWAERKVDRRTGAHRLTHASTENEDEFKLDVEVADDDEATDQDFSIDAPLLIANAHLRSTTSIFIDKKTLEINPVETTEVTEIRACEAGAFGDDGEIVLCCPECGGHKGDGRRFFRRAILGAPFLLGEIIPTLLEFCPDFDEKGVSPMSLPWRGRRMITFTDSRQGTARIAAKLQQDSERNAVRSLIYQRMLQAGRIGADDKAQKLKNDIGALEAVLAGVENEAIRRIVEEKRAELAALSEPQPVQWRDITAWLMTNEPDVRDWIYDYYSDLDPQLFKQSDGRETLARILTMREFARRPKRANSPETMGLVAVRYPKLDSVKVAPAGFSIADWKDFLKIALDFWVRENSFIDLPDSWRKWGGNRLSRKWLLPQDSKEQPSNTLKRWPKCNTSGIQPRLVRLLSYALGKDPLSTTGRDEIDALLLIAWQNLVEVGLLTASTQGRFLQLEDISLSPITKGWLCPVTRRVLDVTFKGVTPYLPRKDISKKYAECSPLAIPLGVVTDDDHAERLNRCRAWLNADASILALRMEGVWTDLNDRIVEGSRYFRTAEHSAQQSGARLQAYERDFKSGRVNLLSCSTTMEMGVDIGGISVVAMNNVPPHPANYLQRAGRAGRRSETRSMALTVCKNNPHDQGVLRNTLWAFTTSISAPSVRLSSALIVQRHINSLLLAAFLKRSIDGHGSADKLDLDWWMLPKGGAPVDRFIAWAECFESQVEASISSGMRTLLVRTCHAGLTNLQSLTRQAAAMVFRHKTDWFNEYEVIQDQLKQFSGSKEKNPAFKALQMQSGRLTGEYLLRELAGAGVLPGYSFPSNIASLDTLTCDEIAREKERKKERRSRDDNAYQRRELPSRDIATALREYAPGAEVVIDGLVYQSRGVTLNWHVPASLQATNEIQSLRRAWRCERCGSSGTATSAENLSHCFDCGALLTCNKQTRFDYLQPAGFAVDLYAAPHNDVSQQSYVPVQRPWVDARGEWRPLSNPVRGKFRVSDAGTVFHYSDGVSGEGYAVCLHCGRAEPMPVDSSLLPEAFQDHKSGKMKEHRRLRGAEGGETAICSGSQSSYAIKSGLRLGHESTTDVLELVFFGLDGKPLNDVVTAYSIAVALRSAVAEQLGIELDELGVETKPVQLSGQATAQAIVIFDRASSGYSSSIADSVSDLIRKAARKLDCQASCPAACQHCLLQFDTRYRIDDLDRNAALRFLTEPWLSGLALPVDLAFFGRDSRAEWQRLPEAISSVIKKPGANKLRLYLQGVPEDWDLAGSPIKRHVRRWLELPLELVAPLSVLDALSCEDRESLFGLSALGGVQVLSSNGVSKAGSNAAVLAEVLFQDGTSEVWASDFAEIGLPDAHWGAVRRAALIVGRTKFEAQALSPYECVTGGSDAPVVTRIEIQGQFDGPIQEQGGRASFADQLLDALGLAPAHDLFRGSAEIVRIEYQDRYLMTPLSCALLVETVSALKRRFEDVWALKSIDVTTLEIRRAGDDFRKPLHVSDTWQTSTERGSALKAAFEYCGIPSSVSCAPKQSCPHGRYLKLILSDGRLVRVTLDQGFSCWRETSRSSLIRTGCPFDFGASVARQGELLANMNLVIEGPEGESYAIVDYGTSESPGVF
ncbi:DEAD/DEAH box helicase [Viridibacterium curvum]|uniref:DEAD/DEAH box helicase n=1 Tax=Viridibacterium curvum TaxID=1101404 RepID=A0ABP9R6X3_9RHOO